MLEPLRQTYAGAPESLRIYVARTDELPGSIRTIDPDDPSGARGLLRAAAADPLDISVAEVVLRRPRPPGQGLGRVRPGYAMSGGVGLGSLLRSRLWRQLRLRRRVWVSLSRTGDTIAVALGPRRLGIDVETLQSALHARQLSELLNPHDRLELSRLRRMRQPAEVTAAWTRVEAYAKFRGRGLNTDPADIRVGTLAAPVVPTPAHVLTVGISESGAPVDQDIPGDAAIYLSVVW